MTAQERARDVDVELRELDRVEVVPVPGRVPHAHEDDGCEPERQAADRRVRDRRLLLRRHLIDQLQLARLVLDVVHAAEGGRAALHHAEAGRVIERLIELRRLQPSMQQ